MSLHVFVHYLLLQNRRLVLDKDTFSSPKYADAMKIYQRQICPGCAVRLNLLLHLLLMCFDFQCWLETKHEQHSPFTFPEDQTSLSQGITFHNSSNSRFPAVMREGEKCAQI